MATDFGESSDAALAYGRVLARELGAALHVVNVVDDVFTRGLEAESIEMWPTFQDDLEATAIRCLEQRVPLEDRRRFGDHIVTRVSSQPADAIAAYAKSASIDLIVMGTHGRSPADLRNVGSVAQRVVRAAVCPVLTIRHPVHAILHPEISAASAIS